MPAYYHSLLSEFLVEDNSKIVGKLIQRAQSEGFYQHVHAQTRAWEEQIQDLQNVSEKLLHQKPASARWTLLIEYPIPRRAKRIDAVLLARDVIFVLEFKIGKAEFALADKQQVEDYCLDLRDFHVESKGRTLVPVLFVPEAASKDTALGIMEDDLVQIVHTINRVGAVAWLIRAFEKHHDGHLSEIDPQAWDRSDYHPTPTIIEAAQTMYAGHSVAAIARSHAGPTNLTLTCDAVLAAVRFAQSNNKKVICFVTGVPGSGKTLAGLNMVHNPELQTKQGGLGVFLSGNGPLVKVLSEALARDQAHREDMKIQEARRRVSTFIQNVHVFIKQYVEAQPDEAPPDRVVLFDEAQRAWDAKQEYRKFKRDESEPHMLYRIMDRHTDWAVIVALIGSGQEIHDGEAGLPEWGRALEKDFSHWHAFVSEELAHGLRNSAGEPLFERVPKHLKLRQDSRLHLAVSTRAYKAEQVSAWVNAVIAGQPTQAMNIITQMAGYPIVLTRSLETVRCWLKRATRGLRRAGLVASSGARRLRPLGLDVTVDPAVTHWFLQPSSDVRSSCYLEVPATEFAIQGLELDWIGVCWGADLRWSSQGWCYHRFSGTKWQSVRKEIQQKYLLNKYRVLLTRAREGMIIWLPEGSDEDPTRPADYYDCTASYLRQCGLAEI